MLTFAQYLGLNRWEHQVKQSNSHQEPDGGGGTLEKRNSKCDVISPVLKPLAYRFSPQRQVELLESSIQKPPPRVPILLSMRCTQSQSAETQLLLT